MESQVEIHKFLKFLAYKYSQIIVQSRLGGLIYTKCNIEGTDWVSLKNTAIEGHQKEKNNKESIDKGLARIIRFRRLTCIIS